MFGPSVPFHSSPLASAAGGTTHYAKRLVSHAHMYSTGRSNTSGLYPIFTEFTDCMICRSRVFFMYFLVNDIYILCQWLPWMLPWSTGQYTQSLCALILQYITRTRESNMTLQHVEICSIYKYWSNCWVFVWDGYLFCKVYEAFYDKGSPYFFWGSSLKEVHTSPENWLKQKQNCIPVNNLTARVY